MLSAAYHDRFPGAAAASISLPVRRRGGARGRARSGLLLGALCLPLILNGCGFLPPAPNADAPVYIIDTEGLTPPAVGFTRAYVPQLYVDLDFADPLAGRVAGFHLVIGSGSPHDLRARLTDRGTGGIADLARIEPPAPAERALIADAPVPYNDAVRARLAAGEPLFWIDDVDPPPAGERVAVLIPESLLTGDVQLSWYTWVNDQGIIFGQDKIDLVRGFYYIEVIGDSIQWGNGLRSADKIHTLVAKRVAAATGLRVITRVHAISGATIVPGPNERPCRIGCSGEVPTGLPSILTQVDLIDRPELVNLVLMDGCINDVGLSTIFDVTVSDDVLAAVTKSACDDAMRGLLRKVRAATLTAEVVVTGYYPILTGSSDPAAITDFAEAVGFGTAEDFAEQLSDAIDHAATFDRVARMSLVAATMSVSAEHPDSPPIRFADPGFGTDNAMLAPDAWLWGVVPDDRLINLLDTAPLLVPEDPRFDFRLANCFNDDVVSGTAVCLYASVGHPNPAGARAYADAVVEQLGLLD